MYIRKIVLIATVFIVSSILLTPVQGQIPTPQEPPMVDISETLNLLQVNLSCVPVCWNDFTPGHSSILEVYQFFSDRFGRSYDIKNDQLAPDNSTGGVFSGVSITAFSDSSQPIPIFRAFQVSLRISIQNGIHSGGSIQEQFATPWLILELLTRYGQPSEMRLNNFQDPRSLEIGNYELIFDFPDHHTLIRYTGGLVGRNGISMICPGENIASLHIWVYGEDELSGFTLLEDLKTYEAFQSTLQPTNPIGDFEYQFDSPGEVAYLVDQFQQTGCIEVDPTIPSPQPPIIPSVMSNEDRPAAVIPTPQEPPVRDITFPLQALGMDLNCIPACWQTFAPSITPMSEVYQFFATLPGSPPSVKRNDDAPNNSVGVNYGGVMAIAFSDDTAFTPILRTFQIALPAMITNGEYDRTSVQETFLDPWLIPQIFLRYGEPGELWLTSSQQAENFFTESHGLLVDFPQHRTLILYNAGIITNDNVEQICPSKTLYSNLRVWVYGDSEVSGFTLIKDLESYEAFQNLQQPYGLIGDFDYHFDTPYEVAYLVDQFQQTGCIDVDPTIPFP